MNADVAQPVSIRRVAARPGGYGRSMQTNLVRPRQGKVIAGVCAALADRFGLSRGLVRVAFVLFGLFGVGELVYIVLWVVIPRADR
jgi:phage shock protein C